MLSLHRKVHLLGKHVGMFGGKRENREKKLLTKQIPKMHEFHYVQTMRCKV